MNYLKFLPFYALAFTVFFLPLASASDLTLETTNAIEALQRYLKKEQVKVKDMFAGVEYLPDAKSKAEVTAVASERSTGQAPWYLR